MTSSAAPAQTPSNASSAGAVAGRLWHSFTQPERLLGVLLAIVLGALVLVPLFELIRETLTVQPYDRAFLPKAQPGEFTLFHYERVFAGRLSWAIFYKPFFNSLVTAFAATIICLVFRGRARLADRAHEHPISELPAHAGDDPLHAAVMGDGARLDHVLQERPHRRSVGRIRLLLRRAAAGLDRLWTDPDHRLPVAALLRLLLPLCVELDHERR